jgi:hypothetical protein
MPTRPWTKAVATRNGWANCASTTWVGGAALELIAITCRVSLDRHGCDVVGPCDLELSARRKRGIDRRVQRSAARIGLITQRLPAIRRSQVAKQHRRVRAIRLVQFEKPEATIKDVARAGKPGLRQNGGENAGTGSLAGLQPLAQSAVQNALAVAGCLTVGDAESG